MKKGFLLIIAMITFFYYSEKAQAAFLLEPYAGMYLNSSYDIDGGGEGDISGTAVGARVGFQNMGLMLGLNGQRSSWTFEPESGSDSDWTFTRLGFFVGYDFPMMLRLWGEYVFSMDGTLDDDSDNKRLGGSGTSFGVGYKVLPFVSLNFELSNLQTAEFETASSDGEIDVAYTTYLFSISLPLSI